MAAVPPFWIWLKLFGNISVASMQRPAKFGRNRSSRAGDIKDFSESNLDVVQRLKLTGNIYIASMRRSAKFGRNLSSRARDIKDLSKSKMAAVPPL